MKKIQWSFRRKANNACPIVGSWPGAATGFCLAVVAMVLAGSPVFAGGSGEESPQKVVLSLDWVPNTNHIGAYVAQQLGYFEQEGLEVNIVQPAESSAEAMVAIGQAQFAYSYQESVTFARTGEDDLPVMALAAVIQHNTSGFASLAEKNIASISDLPGHSYGGWGSPVETALLSHLLQSVGSDLNDIELLNSGSADFFSVSDRDVDFSWVFEGWTVVEAQIRGVDLNYIDLADIDPVFDYYTPVIISSESFVENNPQVTKAFLRALSRGYEYAVEHPREAAEILSQQVPEIPLELGERSLEFLKDEFIAEAPRWGQMEREVWVRYADWLYDNNLISEPLDVDMSYSNDYLPE